MLENARMCLEEAKRLEPEHPSIDIRLASLCLIQQDYKGFEKYNQLLDQLIAYSYQCFRFGGTAYGNFPRLFCFIDFFFFQINISFL